jgi:hypothetical protein
VRPRVEHIVGRLYNARYDSQPASANTMRIFVGIRAELVKLARMNSASQFIFQVHAAL